MTTRSPTDVAIIGMACILPGAGDLRGYWRNLVEGFDAITEVPPGRWESEFYDPDSDAIDRIYCKRGGFIDEFAEFDPLKWGLMPVAVEGGEPDQMLVLETASRALTDAGYQDREFPRDRTAVILGRGGYITAGSMRFLQAARTAQELVNFLAALLPDVSPDKLEEIKRDYQSHFPGVNPGTVIGLVPNLAASRIANRLDLRGPAYTVDAACASSLIAVDQACVELNSGRCDLVLAGGVHVSVGEGFWSVFCQLGALSRSQQARPFHRRADGLLIGEGVGTLVLKRLEDAERDDDRVYAVIRGTGTSSDGRESTVMQPRPSSQVLAIERAWQTPGLDPSEPGAVGLIEAHGTATVAGDAAELETLKRVFGSPAGHGPKPGLGSVKSMIGHTMATAGMASLIKTALAVYHGQLLPTLHCEEPHPDIEQTRFRLITSTEPWEGSSSPRRAGVNAFGFGGINAHVLLEEHAPAGRRHLAGSPGEGATDQARVPALLVEGSTKEDLLAALESDAGETGSGSCRVAILDPTPERLERARRAIELGRPFRDRKGGVWFTPDGEISRGGRIAFVYPGVDAGFVPRIDEVAQLFGRPGLPPLDPSDLEQLGISIALANRLLTDVMLELGIEPDFMAGHSIGEWSAMIAAGVIHDETIEQLIHSIAPGRLKVPDVLFAAVGCGRERVESLGPEVGDVSVALDNCPHQSIICGSEESVRGVVASLRSEGVLCQELSFQSGFHSPHFHSFLEPIEEIVADLPLNPPQRELWSATTCGPFPQEPDAIRDLFLEHLVRPVRFRELTEKMYEAGARVFIQVGAGSLVGFMDDTLHGRSHLTTTAHDRRVGSVQQLQRLAAALWVEGLEFDHERLLDPVRESAPKGRAMQLSLSAPMITASSTLDRGASRATIDFPPELVEGDPILEQFQATAQALDRAQRDVVVAWQERSSDNGHLAPRKARFQRHLSLDRNPELVDHSLFPLPDEWPSPEDGFPVVPMTMSLEIMLQTARELVPERLAIGVENVRAYRWIGVERPVDLTIEAAFDGADRVHLKLGEFLEGDVIVANRYPTAPDPKGGPLPKEKAIDETAEAMYARRLMFHGPEYRSVSELTAISQDGVRGRVVNLPASGALFDGCGQILGYWIKQQTVKDRLAFPVIVDSFMLFGPDPDVGAELDCTVWVRHFGKNMIRADFEVTDGDRVLAICRGWQDRRLENEEWMWPVIQRPEYNALAKPHPSIPGASWLDHTIRSSATMDSFARRYLNPTEMETYRSLPDGDRKVDWLAGRLTAKDAVRHWLWNEGHGPVFPIEIEIVGAPGEAPGVECKYVKHLALSIAHKQGNAVAIVTTGDTVGIDMERVEPRDEAFETFAFTAHERRLIPIEDREEWITRSWAAKEAIAKWRGTGLGGNPQRYEIEALDGERLRCGDHWVSTCRIDDWVFAWTNEEGG